MNKIYKKLWESGWKAGKTPFSLTNDKGYTLVEDTSSWIMLLDPNGKRIWDYPVLARYAGWICNSIERECKNDLLKQKIENE